MSTRDRETSHRQRDTSRSDTKDKLPPRLVREDDRDRHRRRSDPATDRYDLPHGKGHKRELSSHHRLSDSRRGDEPPKAASDHKPSQGRQGQALLEQTWQGRLPPNISQSDDSRHKLENQHSIGRQRDRSTPRDRMQGRFVVPHSQQVSVPMQDVRAQAAYPQAAYPQAAYPQTWPSRDQQRPHRPDPFRGGGKWKHDLFEELIKPPVTAEQGGVNNTAAKADPVSSASGDPA